MSTEYQTKVLDPGTPITVANLTGKSIKFVPMGLGIIKEAAYFNDGIHTYHIEYTDDELTYKDEVFDHILNSFKFIPIVNNVPINDNISVLDENKEDENNEEDNENDPDDDDGDDRNN